MASWISKISGRFLDASMVIVYGFITALSGLYARRWYRGTGSSVGREGYTSRAVRALWFGDLDGWLPSKLRHSAGHHRRHRDHAARTAGHRLPRLHLPVTLPDVAPKDSGITRPVHSPDDHRAQQLALHSPPMMRSNHMTPAIECCRLDLGVRSRFTDTVESRTGASAVGSGGQSGAFAPGPQSGSRDYVSSPRSSNRTCRFPASGFRTRSCRRTRKAQGLPRQMK